MKKFIDWLLDHGAGIAFTFILMLSLCIVSLGVFVLVGLKIVWDKIH